MLELNRSRTSSPLCSLPATPATRSRTSPPLYLEQSHPQNRSSSSESVRAGGRGGGARAVVEEEELGRWRRRKEISQFLAQSFSLSPFPPPLPHTTYSLCLAPHTVAPTQPMHTKHMHTCTHTHTVGNKTATLNPKPMHTKHMHICTRTLAHTHTQLATKLLP